VGQPLLPYTGPVYLFTATGASNTPEFLGTAEETPDIDFFPVITPVFNDIAGERPFDRQDHGEEAVVSLISNRWDEAVYKKCVAFKGFSPGLALRYHVGTYLIQNDETFRLYLVFPLGGGGDTAKNSSPNSAPVATNTTQGMPGGYRFYAAFVEKHRKLRLGTRNNALLLQFRCMMQYQNYVTPGNQLSRGHLLYDYDVSEVNVAAL
jgi:hypothetical protein